MEHPKKVRRTVKQYFALFSIKIVGYKWQIALNIRFMRAIELANPVLKISQ